MRVAAVDVGTNTVMLLVAESAPDGSMRALVDRATITRLGEGTDRARVLLPQAVARTRACLEKYAYTVRELGAKRVAIVATSAMRDARGGDELRESIRALFGVEVRVLSGVQEAQLTFSGGVAGLSLRSDVEVALFDIGGGSTEVAIGWAVHPSPALSYARSFDIGSVRLTERHVCSDPPSVAELDAIAASARATFAGVPKLASGEMPIGVAGTVTTLAAVACSIVPYDGARVHGLVLARDKLQEVVRHLASMPLSERRVVPGMEPKRADVIVAGGLVALALLDHWGAGAMRISDRGLRWGLAHELLEASSGA